MKQKITNIINKYYHYYYYIHIILLLSLDSTLIHVLHSFTHSHVIHIIITPPSSLHTDIYMYIHTLCYATLDFKRSVSPDRRRCLTSSRNVCLLTRSTRTRVCTLLPSEGSLAASGASQSPPSL